MQTRQLWCDIRIVPPVRRVAGSTRSRQRHPISPPRQPARYGPGVDVHAGRLWPRPAPPPLPYHSAPAGVSRLRSPSAVSRCPLDRPPCAPPKTPRAAITSGPPGPVLQHGPSCQAVSTSADTAASGLSGQPPSMLRGAHSSSQCSMGGGLARHRANPERVVLSLPPGGRVEGMPTRRLPGYV